MLYYRTVPAGKSKAFIIGAIAVIGIAAVIAGAVAVGVIFGVSTSSELNRYIVFDTDISFHH